MTLSQALALLCRSLVLAIYVLSFLKKKKEVLIASSKREESNIPFAVCPNWLCKAQQFLVFEKLLKNATFTFQMIWNCLLVVKGNILNIALM